MMDLMVMSLTFIHAVVKPTCPFHLHRRIPSHTSNIFQLRLIIDGLVALGLENTRDVMVIRVNNKMLLVLNS